MKNIIPHLTAALLLCASPVYAASAMSDLPVDSRIKILPYNPTDVYTVPTKYGYQTSIVFAPSETIKTVSVGDRSMWQIVPSGNRIFIRPMDDGLTTNMTVITNLREYNFDIKSVAAKASGNLYVIQFDYGSPHAAAAPDPYTRDMAAVPELAPVVPSHISIPPLDTQRTQSRNDHYTYSGNDSIAPAQVYDDGRMTYVTYNQMPSPAPQPFVIGESGKPALAAYRTSGNTIVIHNVAAGFILKSSNGDVTVYNEQFHNPS